MAEISPAVLAESTEAYRHDLERAASLSDRIQIDLADGKFASNKTINLAQVYWPEHVRADLHIMHQNPLEHLPTLVAMGPDLVIFHAESEGINRDSLDDARVQLETAGTRIGLALLPQTSVEDVSDLLTYMDHVLIFTGELGHYGGELQTECLEKITAAKKVNKEIEVGVDGGINADNAGEIVSAGADVLNVGGYLQKADDPVKAYAKLESVISNYQ